MLQHQYVFNNKFDDINATFELTQQAPRNSTASEKGSQPVPKLRMVW